MKKILVYDLFGIFILEKNSFIDCLLEFYILVGLNYVNIIVFYLN